MDLRRYKLIRERKQYIGISNREAYQAMCEDLAFAQQSLKTVLNDYADLFRKRFSEGLSIRKAADTMQQNRGVIEVGRPHSIGRSPSFCSSGMRQTVSVG